MRRFIVLAVLGALALPLAPAPGQRPPFRDHRGAELNERYSGLVDGWYRRYLRRQADPTGLAVHVSMLMAGAAQETIVAGILSSPEYYNLAGGDDRRYVARLIADVTGRPANPREMAFLLNRLTQEEQSQMAYEYLTLHPEGLQVAVAPPVPEPEHEYRREYHHDYDHDRRERRDR